MPTAPSTASARSSNPTEGAGASGGARSRGRPEMDFELPSEVQGLVAIARQFREERLAPLEGEFLREGNVEWALRPRLQDEARERGLWAIDVPAEHGGLGLGQLAVCAVHEELNKHPMMFEVGGNLEP